MATIKQKEALKKIIENHGNISKSMREVGYKNSTAVNPKNLTESDGFKELCKEHGLTPELVVDSLKDDILNKPQKRKEELELAAKILGMLRNNFGLFGDIGLISKEDIDRLKNIK